MLRWIRALLRWLLDLLRRLFGHAEDHHREPPLPPELGETTGGVGAGGTYVFVRNELVVRSEQTETVLRLLRELRPDVRWREVEVVPYEGLEVTRLRLPAGAPPVPELMDAIRFERGTSLAVNPNHVLGLASHPGLIPCGPPLPAAAAEQLEQRISGASYEEAPDEVLVGVLDTGVVDHPWLKKRCTFRDPEDLDEPDRDQDGKLDYGAGHGTFIAGVILQYAPAARVIARRLATTSTGPLPHQPYATDIELAQGLAEWSKDPQFKQLRVLVLAMGGYTYAGEGLLTTGQALRMCRLENPDLVVVAGAGNDGTTRPFFPAALKDVVAVTALAEGEVDERACFSNQGWWVDACAPGVSLISTFPPWGDWYVAPYPDPTQVCVGVVPPTPTVQEDFGLTAVWRGTSFAAPIVGAWIAQRIATTGASGLQAVLDLKGTIGAAAALPGLGQWLPDLGRVVRPPFVTP